MTLGEAAPIRVVANPERFKARLGIGEDAYATRRTLRAAGTLWDSASAATSAAGVAKSATFAAMVAPAATSANPLVWMGIMAPAAAVTPVGWVIAAAVLGGGAWYGVSRWMASQPDAFVDVIPRFLNTPIDALAVRLLDLHAGLAFHISAADGHVDDTEREVIAAYFEDEWGYDPAYLRFALPLIGRDAGDKDLVQLTKALIEFHRGSRDCAPKALEMGLSVFLRDVAAADGIVAAGENDLLTDFDQRLKEAQGVTLASATLAMSDGLTTLVDSGTQAAEEVRAAIVGSGERVVTALRGFGASIAKMRPPAE